MSIYWSLKSLIKIDKRKIRQCEPLRRYFLYSKCTKCYFDIKKHKLLIFLKPDNKTTFYKKMVYQIFFFKKIKDLKRNNNNNWYFETQLKKFFEKRTEEGINLDGGSRWKKTFLETVEMVIYFFVLEHLSNSPMKIASYEQFRKYFFRKRRRWLNNSGTQSIRKIYFS